MVWLLSGVTYEQEWKKLIAKKLESTFGIRISTTILSRSWGRNTHTKQSVHTHTQHIHTQEMTEECPICYEYRWNGVVPSIICPNTHCAKAFHTECFKEVIIFLIPGTICHVLRLCSLQYVRSLPRTDGLQSKCLVGDCPFCSQVGGVFTCTHSWYLLWGFLQSHRSLH